MTWVVDANIAVWTVLPNPYGVSRSRMHHIMRQEVVVSGLWVYEVTSVLYRHAGTLGREWLSSTLPTVLALADEVILADRALAADACSWAERLGQSKTYDAFYLDLAERLGAAFWTGDQWLYRCARQVGAEFVRFVGED